MLGNFNSTIPNRSWSQEPKADSQMQNRDFKAWTASGMYRTSYRDMIKKYPQKQKKYAVPGYAGYIPSVKADNMFGKTFTEISKETFNREKYLLPRVTEFFPSRPFTTNAMGRTLGRLGGGLDDEFHTVSRFHGKSTLAKEHPNVAEAEWSTTYEKSFVPQEQVRPKLFRTTHTDFWDKCTASTRPKTHQSGFVQNRTEFDGHGWVPIKQLHGDNTTTEYRSRFNPGKPFHPKPLKANQPKLKKRELVY